MSEEGQETTTKILVAAIDIGTSFSGWSILTRHDFQSDCMKVYAKNWNNGTNISTKTPTTVLIDPDGETLFGFGYEAEDQYATLMTNKLHKDYYYFRRFKMTLHEQANLKRDVTLKDEHGNELPALTVFSLAIKYLYVDVLRECVTRFFGGEAYTVSMIDWVITVPAIWRDAAKQFMKEAACLAGLPENRLTIALEPESASIFCKKLPVEPHTRSRGFDVTTFSPGAKYIVLDAGGGTVDITVHEILPNDNIKELHAASGGPWGGTKVDDNVLELLDTLVGPTIMENFKQEHMDDFLEMFRGLEIKKRRVSFTSGADYLQLPATLMEMYAKETEEDLKTAVTRANRENVSLQGGNKLQMDADLMRAFFDPVVEKILDHLQMLTRQYTVKDIKVLLMVGGFSESVYLQENIKRKFPNMKVIVPPEPSLVVLKGAAIFGHAERIIKERVSPLTYGFIGLADFIEGVHPEHNSVLIEGKGKKLKDAFFKLVAKGEVIGIDEVREWDKNRIVSNDQDYITFPLYGSSEENPLGSWSDNTFRVGVLKAKITNMAVPRKQRAFKVSGIFGKTQIELRAKELSTGKLTTVTFDALSNWR